MSDRKRRKEKQFFFNVSYIMHADIRDMYKQTQRLLGNNTSNKEKEVKRNNIFEGCTYREPGRYMDT